MAEGPKDDGVGYKKPPKHSQFPPGVSGNTGRRKRPETHGEIIARIRDEQVMVGDKLMTKFELAIMQVVNQTIKSGKPRDLKIMLELLEKHGAITQGDPWADARGAADKVIEKIRNNFLATKNIDPADFEEWRHHELEEVRLVISCPQCGPALKAGWTSNDYKELTKRIGKTFLHGEVEHLHSKGGWKK